MPEITKWKAVSCRRHKRHVARTRLLVVLSVIPILLSISGPAAADDGRVDWSAQLRWGLEYDDNPQRLDGYEGGGDSLTRYVFGGDARSPVGEDGQVSVSLRHGGKFFRRQTAANAAVTQVGGSGTWRQSRWFYLQGLVDLKDRSERGRDRDYTRGGAALRVGSSLGPTRLWADGGWRFFTFKPTPSSSNRGPQLRLGARWLIRGDLVGQLSWTRRWRSYDRIALTVRDDRFVPLGDDVERRDLYQVWAASLQYRDRINARLRYQLAINDSNSYGQGFRRHALEARLTVPLPWEVFVSARAELQRARYESPIDIDDSLRLDEDHRNAFVAAASRNIVGPWEAELRYSIFAHEFGADGDYRRQTIALLIGIHLDGG